MIPVKLKLSNFTSYSENPPQLDFTKFKLAAVSGLNGAGKSSLLDAVTWCIWGTSRAGDSSDTLIHQGADNMQVEFSFKLDGHLYIIKRRRFKKGGGSTALELWSNSHNLTEGTIKATQEKIVSALHLTFETFSNSSYLRQGHADEFTTKGPTERKRILTNILGLDHYDILEEKAKEKSKERAIKLQLLDYQLLEIEAELSQKENRQKQLDDVKNKVSLLEENVKSLEQDIKILQKEKEVLKIAGEQRIKIEQNLLEQQQELAQIVLSGTERAERIKNLESRVKSQDNLDQKISQLKKTQSEIDNLRKMQQEKLQLQKTLADLQGQLNLKNHQKQTLENEIKKTSEEIKKLSAPTAKCPTCGQEIGKEQRQKVTADLRFQIKDLEKNISEIKTENEKKAITNLEGKLSILKFDPEKLTQLENSLITLESLQKQKEQALQDTASLSSEKKTREELLLLYQNKKAQVEKTAASLKELPEMTGDLTKTETDLIAKETQFNSLRKEENEARGLLGQAKQLISRTEQLEKLTKQRMDEKNKLMEEKENFEELALAFGKKGIQAMIIETAIPEIEDEANRLLEKLSEGRMKIGLQTQKETKTKLSDGEKGIIETLDIIISDEMGERAYELYSGGEAFRVNFAIRLAISKLLTHRAGAKLQFLVIDEGFGSQDTPGRARLVEAIDAIKDDFEKILIITHIEELKEEFPVRIEVSKNSTGSTFEVVGV